jgi:hypothetical protein
MSDPPSLNDLIEKREKAAARVKRAEAALGNAKKDFEELEIALNVLAKHGFIAGDQAQPKPKIVEAVGFTNPKHGMIFDQIPIGERYAVSPKEIIDAVRSKGSNVTPDYVRTVLWRFADRGTVENTDGRYWRHPLEQEKEEASDAETSEASETTGPVGREGGYPPSTPEGSIPSGSTPVQAHSFDEDLDDDVPF